MFHPSESGALTLRVATEDGTPVPGVMLTITNLASQLDRITITDAEGVGRFRVIPPGGYDLRARRTGFNTVVHSNIEVDAGQVTDVALILLPATPGG